MLTTSLKAAWAHKRRLISTTVSVLLGVAFMSGTMVLSDTLDRSFNDLFGEVYSETDAEIRGPVLIDTGFGTLREPLDDDLIEIVSGVEGVEAVGPYVETQRSRVLGDDGEPIGAENGPPTIVQSWIDDEALSGVTLAEGRPPEADDELVLNLGAAEEAGVAVGDQIEVFSPDGTRTFTLVGTYRFGERDSALGAVTAGVTLPVAQELGEMSGQITSISARGAEGVSQEELVQRIEAAMPADSEGVVLTGDEVADDIADEVAAGLGFFTTLLLVFAFIALIVGAFIIFNTFSILVAQRGRELALMRTLGASRRQVFTSVLTEAAIIGLVAAIIGLGAGVLLAIGVQALLDAIGLDLPTTGLSITRGAMIAALVTGLVVTVGSALVPAWRATRVPPLAALRDVATDTSGRSRLRIAIGVVLVVVAVVAALPAFGPDPDLDTVQSVGLAALALLVGLVVLGPVMARPLARLLGAALPAFKGTTGVLARENAARSPKRTASTAAALMIGVALVVFINVFAASARASIDDEVSRGIEAEFIAQSSGFNLGIPLSFADEARAVDGVDAVATVQGWFAQVERPDGDTSDTFVSAVDPDSYQRTINVTMTEGELSDLEPGTMIYDRRLARDNDVSVGDELTILFTSGEEASFTVVAISDQPQLLGTRVLHQDDWERYATNITDQTVFIRVDEGVDPTSVRGALDELAAEYPTVEVQDQDEFLGGIASQLNTILNVLYGLLALSIIIALIGIANTLSLSIHERTRELGLLRAVGMTRRQVRTAVRWEAAIISVIGTGLGLAFGLVSSYVLVEALKTEGLTQFSLPVTPLVVITVLFAALGVLAAVMPARRAASLNVLDAIATE